MKNTNNRTKKMDVIIMLGYSATALSVVSFLTTLNGIKGIVTDNTIYATLISFGIQSIILVMGLWFVTATKMIWRKKVSQMIKVIAIILMITAYVCSVAFSSFFSFVYLSNAAYSGVRSIDYNMELEVFLVENTKEIKNINNAIENILLRNIRDSVPRFRTLMDEYKTMANQEIQDIINKRTKYDVSSIPDTVRFNAESAITAYEGANGRTANSRLSADCQRLESDVNQYIDRYIDWYYPTYSDYFDNMVLQTDISELEARKADISGFISVLESEIALLNKFEYKAINSINSYVQGRCNVIISYYKNLETKCKELINTYDEIDENSIIIQGDELALQSFYEMIYSANILTGQELENAEVELQSIVSSYIKNAETIDEDSVASLTQCIEYLDVLNRSRDLMDKIKKYEDNNLSVTYIVISDQKTGEGTNIANSVYETEWIETRHKDVAEFISIIKALPDLDLILPDSDERELAEDTNLRYLIEKDRENYVTNILAQAYEYSRAKLENISDMERARNYLYSENKFLAIFCCAIAVFLDVASFFIGLCMYVCQEKNQDISINGNSEKSQKSTAIMEMQLPEEHGKDEKDGVN